MVLFFVAKSRARAYYALHMTSPARPTNPLAFAWAYLKDLHVAALAPSSPRLVARLMHHLRAVEPRLIVELGPGDGVATAAALDLLSPHGQLLAVERNHDFAAALAAWPDRRLFVTEGDARRADELYGDQLGRADAVIASIPFTYLSPADREAVARAAAKLLRPGGIFVIFHQYSPLMRPVIKRVFGHVHTEFELFNVMPCFLMTATKK